jgi:hypothetical protein
MGEFLDAIRRSPTAHGGPTGREKLLRMAEEWLAEIGDRVCWIPPGYENASRYRYAQINIDGKCLRAHRVMYELLVGPIPPGMVLDHIWERGCRNKACLNALWHLEPVSVAENNIRAIAAGQRPPHHRRRRR